MRIEKLKNHVPFDCKSNVWILAFTWCVGLLCGTFLSIFSRSSYVSLMHAATYRSVTIVGLLLCNFLPLLLTAFAVCYSFVIAAVIVSFLRAVILGACMFGILFAFGSCGWLICMLMLFSSNWINVLIAWLLLYVKESALSDLLGRVVVSVAIAAVVSLVDYLYVSPLLAGILELH